MGYTSAARAHDVQMACILQKEVKENPANALENTGKQDW